MHKKPFSHRKAVLGSHSGCRLVVGMRICEMWEGQQKGLWATTAEVDCKIYFRGPRLCSSALTAFVLLVCKVDMLRVIYV